MNIYVYDYLKNFGFNKKEIDYIYCNNDYIWGANVHLCEMNINYFYDKKLNNDEIHNIILKNPLLLTENPRKFDEIDNLFNTLLFEEKEMKHIIIFNSKIYNNPAKLQKIVELLMNDNYSDKQIKNILLNSKDYLDNENSDVKNLVIERKL